MSPTLPAGSGWATEARGPRESRWFGVISRETFRHATTVKCGLLLAVGVGASALLQDFPSRGSGLSALIVFSTASILVGLADSFRKVREEVQREARELRVTVPRLAANQQSAARLVDRFPGIHVPTSTFSMMAANLEALVDILTRRKPRLIVELGSGISTLVVAAWLREEGSGRLVSFEHDAEFAEACEAYLKRHGLDLYAEVRVVGLRPRQALGVEVAWYDVEDRLVGLEGVDLLIVDGPQGDVPDRVLARMPAMEVFHGRLSDRATVFLDDGLRPGERKIARAWSERFPEFEARLHPTLTGYWTFTRQGRRAPASQTGTW